MTLLYSVGVDRFCLILLCACGPIGRRLWGPQLRVFLSWTIFSWNRWVACMMLRQPGRGKAGQYACVCWRLKPVTWTCLSRHVHSLSCTSHREILSSLLCSSCRCLLSWCCLLALVIWIGSWPASFGPFGGSCSGVGHSVVNLVNLVNLISQVQ